MTKPRTVITSTGDIVEVEREYRVTFDEMTGEVQSIEGWADERPNLDRPFTSAKDGKDLRPRRRTGPMLRIRDREGRFVR